jgi:hypothetical protein
MPTPQCDELLTLHFRFPLAGSALIETCHAAPIGELYASDNPALRRLSGCER